MKSECTRVAMVTGSAKRLGAAMVSALHEDGFNVIIHYFHSGERAKELADSLNDKRLNSAITLQGDLKRTEVCTAVVDRGVAEWGRLDVLINNASVFYPSNDASLLPQQWQDLMGSNLKAPFFLTHAAREYLQVSRGCVVNLSDIYAKKAKAGHSIYSLSKAGIENMTKSLARELAPAIRVNAIAPGAILWPDITGRDEQEQRRIQAEIPLGRLGTESDIVDALRYLIHADYVTGQILTVDGGRQLVF